MLKTRIDSELKKPKSDRKKSFLKSLLKEAKSLRRTIKEIKRDHSKKCPHCGKDL